MFTRRVFAGWAIVLLAAGGVAQEHQHGKGEKLGAVHFATSCNAEAQREFDRAVALLHSFQFNQAIQGYKATECRPCREEVENLRHVFFLSGSEERLTDQALGSCRRET
jgi:hypothetical protein